MEEVEQPSPAASSGGPAAASPSPHQQQQSGAVGGLCRDLLAGPSSGGLSHAAQTHPSAQDGADVPLPTPGARNYGYPDDFMMYSFKVELCTRQDKHPRGSCPFAHPGDVARRRHPRLYQALLCPEVRAKKICPRVEDCQCSHSAFEFWLHPDRYRTSMCEKGLSCSRPVCFFAHTYEELRPLPDGLKPAAPDDTSSRRTTSSSSSSNPRQQQQQGMGVLPAQAQYAQHPAMLHLAPGMAPGPAGYSPTGYVVPAAVPGGSSLHAGAAAGPQQPQYHGSVLIMQSTGQQRYVLQPAPAGMQHQQPGGSPRHLHQQPPAQLPSVLHQFQQLGVSGGGYTAVDAAATDAGWASVQQQLPPPPPLHAPQAPPSMEQQQQQQVVMVPSARERVRQAYGPQQVLYLPATSMPPHAAWGGAQPPAFQQQQQQQHSAYHQHHHQHAAFGATSYSMPHVRAAGSGQPASLVFAVPAAGAAHGPPNATPSSAGQLLQHPGSSALTLLAQAPPPLLPSQAGGVVDAGSLGSAPPAATGHPANLGVPSGRMAGSTPHQQQ